MLVEPPGQVVPPRSPAYRLDPRHLRLAAAAGAALVALTSTGDVLLLGVLLGVAALELEAGVAAVFAAFSVVVRWGSSSLSALAGAQSVLGAAAAIGSSSSALSSALAGLTFVLVPAGRADEPALAVAAGLAAGAVAAGPSAADRLGLRLVGMVVAVALAYAASRLLPRRPTVYAAIALAVVACLLAAT
jgi:hypothetical protein